MELALVIKLIDLAIVAAQVGPSLLASVQKTRDDLQKMVTEGRNPTAQELAALRSHIDQARLRLHQP